MNTRQDGIAYLLRVIRQLRADLNLSRNETRRQKARAELATERLRRKKGNKG